MEMLYIEGEALPDWPTALERALHRNPHYAYCREIGQLLPAGLYHIERNGYESFIRQRSLQGARLGDIKPTTLVRTTGWSNIFKGAYSPLPFNSQHSTNTPLDFSSEFLKQAVVPLPDHQSTSARNKNAIRSN